MPDEATPVEGEVPAPQTEETPGPVSGPEDNGIPANSPEIDYEQRYSDLRSEFDRRNQQYSEAERLQVALSGQAGPDAQAQALRAFGIELEDEEADQFNELDEFDPDARIDRLEAMLEEQQAAAEQEAYVEAETEFLTEGIESLEQSEGREFSDQEIAILASVARANPNEQGLPDLQVAHAHLSELLQDRQSAWVESKKAARRPGSGIAAERAADLDNDEARVQFIADRIAAADAD
jgi:hypothetical protein